MTNGWFSPGGTFTAEDVAEHPAEITDTAGMIIPGSIFDENEHTLTHAAVS